MKKIVLSIITCFAMVQSGYAATSALTESLLEYEAITLAIGTDPNFQNVIPSIEFIVDIERITDQINVLGEVRYEIKTHTPEHGCDHHHTVKYIATLLVSPNPGIGPNIVTVLSIIPAHHHDHDDDHHHHH